MRPLILMPSINSHNSNACYLQLLFVQRCQHPPAAERCCWGGGPDPPSSRALLLGGGSAMGLGVRGGYRAVCGRSLRLDVITFLRPLQSPGRRSPTATPAWTRPPALPPRRRPCRRPERCRPRPESAQPRGGLAARVAAGVAPAIGQVATRGRRMASAALLLVRLYVRRTISYARFDRTSYRW